MARSKNTPRLDPKFLRQTETTRSKAQKRDKVGASLWKPRLSIWDKLSKIWPTKGALSELNRSNGTRSVHFQSHLTASGPVTRCLLAAWKRTHTSGPEILANCSAETLQEIALVTRGGGLDNSDLVGSAPRKRRLLRARRLSTRIQGSNKLATRRRYRRMTGTSYKPSLTAEYIPKVTFSAVNMHQNQKTGTRWKNEHVDTGDPFHRRFSDTAHALFNRAHAAAATEEQVTNSVIPLVDGESRLVDGEIRDQMRHGGKLPFRNLDPLLSLLDDDDLVPGNLDIYYGARPTQVSDPPEMLSAVSSILPHRPIYL
ncbi:hypothetical protein K402DRAFT_408249 [Aulographum hederae CBS 113979]|uniref:Uncharacterized protein n=1 Tax=Aulographum hederae CBS 113979 TaxID=1176131 RepID=A0A6G1GLT4_9PEZI|nr:hypothetical protein K402DRAFT_408249 [Aulographum hederae CBS 113979]